MRYADIDGDGIIEAPGDDLLRFTEEHMGYSEGDGDGFDARLDFNCDLTLDATDMEFIMGLNGTVVDLTCPVDPMVIVFLADATCYMDSNCSGNPPLPSQPMMDLHMLREGLINAVQSIDPRHKVGYALFKNNSYILGYPPSTNHSAVILSITNMMETGTGTVINYSSPLSVVRWWFDVYSAGGEKHLVFIGTFAPNMPQVYSGCPTSQFPSVPECAVAKGAAPLKEDGVNLVSVLAQSSTPHSPVAISIPFLMSLSSTNSVYLMNLASLDFSLLVNQINAAVCIPNATPTPTATPTATSAGGPTAIPDPPGPPISTWTPTPTNVPGTPTPTPTRTSTPTRTPTLNPTSPSAPTNTPTLTPTSAAGQLTPTPTPTGTVTPTPVAWATVVADRDTFISRYSFSPDVTHGHLPYLAVAYTNPIGDEQVSLIGFNLTQWPNNRGDDIRTARLRLYAESGTGTIRVYWLFRSDWTESATWHMTGVPGTSWYQPGMQIARDYFTYQDLVEVPVTTTGWITIDITHLVRSALDVNPTYVGVNIRR